MRKRSTFVAVTVKQYSTYFADLCDLPVGRRLRAERAGHHWRVERWAAEMLWLVQFLPATDFAEVCRCVLGSVDPEEGARLLTSTALLAWAEVRAKRVREEVLQAARNLPRKPTTLAEILT